MKTVIHTEKGIVPMVSVQDLKLIDAARKFIDNNFIGVVSSSFYTSSTAKNKDIEKGLFSFSVSLELGWDNNSFPEIFNKDNYVVEMKKEMSNLLGGKEIRYFNVSLSISDFTKDPPKVDETDRYVISLHFEVKLA